MPKDYMLNLRISSEDMEAMKVEADMLGMTFTEYLRKLLSHRRCLREKLLEDLKMRIRMFEERMDSDRTLTKYEK